MCLGCTIKMHLVGKNLNRFGLGKEVQGPRSDVNGCVKRCMYKEFVSGFTKLHSFK